MYSGFQLAQKYLTYYYHASNGKGHGVHSPFVFDFITKVLNDKTKYPIYNRIEKQRRSLLQDDRSIQVSDPGAGSAMINGHIRKVKAIAATSLKPAKYAQLMYRIATYYNCKVILEMGTSLGITTAYLAAAPNAEVYTMEGSVEIAAIAEETHEKLQMRNISIKKGLFAIELDKVLNVISTPDLIFIDGDHRRAPLLSYFNTLLKASSSNTIFIIDDIHWSKEMEEAWEEIKSHPGVTLTIDLFFIGIVLLKPDFKATQHFSIRF